MSDQCCLALTTRAVCAEYGPIIDSSIEEPRAPQIASSLAQHESKGV